jgi:branched-chain amino acid aminotransferase
MREIVERVNLDWDQLPFDYMKTDGNVQYAYRDGKWDEGEVVEEDKISISIASTCLHYGQEVFEGLKVFESKDGRVLAFRPEDNGKRLERSGKKLFMATPTVDMFMEAVERVVKVNRRFIPPYGTGAALYLRPLLIGVTGTVGIKPSKEYVFLVLATPVGPYFKGGMKPIRLLVEEVIDRAAPDGVGDVKTGGNYAAGLRGMAKAREAGFAEALYLDAKEKKFVTETGASNFFGITKDGKYVTPKCDTILRSITNVSLMQIAKDLGLQVEHRPVPVEELASLAEAGAVGTAAVITPVCVLGYKGKEIRLTRDDEIGPWTQKIYDRLVEIQRGDVEDTHGWTHEIALD